MYGQIRTVPGGIASVFTCFGLPSALAIMLYGPIVYFHRDVKQAFSVAQGMEA